MTFACDWKAHAVETGNPEARSSMAVVRGALGGSLERLVR
jgi:hypothetical protein